MRKTAQISTVLMVCVVLSSLAFQPAFSIHKPFASKVSLSRALQGQNDLYSYYAELPSLEKVSLDLSPENLMEKEYLGEPTEALLNAYDFIGKYSEKNPGIETCDYFRRAGDDEVAKALANSIQRQSERLQLTYRMSDAAKIFEETGDYIKAGNAFGLALSGLGTTEREQFDAVEYLCRHFENSNRRQKAKKILESCCSADDFKVLAGDRYFEFLKRNNHNTDAHKELLKLTRPSISGTSKCNTFGAVMIASKFLALGRFQDAARYYEKELRNVSMDPEHGPNFDCESLQSSQLTYYLRLAYCHQKLGDKNKSNLILLPVSRSLLALVNGNPHKIGQSLLKDIFDNLLYVGDIYYDQGDKSKAIQHFESADKLADIWEHEAYKDSFEERLYSLKCGKPIPASKRFPNNNNDPDVEPNPGTPLLTRDAYFAFTREQTGSAGALSQEFMSLIEKTFNRAEEHNCAFFKMQGSVSQFLTLLRLIEKTGRIDYVSSLLKRLERDMLSTKPGQPALIGLKIYKAHLQIKLQTTNKMPDSKIWNDVDRWLLKEMAAYIKWSLEAKAKTSLLPELLRLRASCYRINEQYEIAEELLQHAVRVVSVQKNKELAGKSQTASYKFLTEVHTRLLWEIAITRASQGRCKNALSSANEALINTTYQELNSQASPIQALAREFGEVMKKQKYFEQNVHILNSLIAKSSFSPAPNIRNKAISSTECTDAQEDFMILLAENYQAAKDYANAEKVLRHALSLQTDKMSRAIIQLRLGDLLEFANKPSEALHFYLSYLAFVNSEGISTQGNRRWSSSTKLSLQEERLWRKVLAIQEKLYGEDNPQLIDTLYNVARYADNFNRSEILDRALKIQEMHHAGGPAKRAKLLMDAIAPPGFEIAFYYETAKCLYESGDFRCLNYLEYIAQDYLANGKADKAVRVTEEMLNWRKNLKSPAMYSDYQPTISFDLIERLCRAGKYSDALRLLTLEIQNAHESGTNFAFELEAVAHRAEVCAAAREFDECEKDIAVLFDMYKSRTFVHTYEYHCDPMDFVGEAANICERRGNTKLAFAIFERLIKFQMEHLRPDDPRLGYALDNLAQLRIKHYQYKTARQNLYRARVISSLSESDESLPKQDLEWNTNSLSKELEWLDQKIRIMDRRLNNKPIKSRLTNKPYPSQTLAKRDSVS